MRWEKFYSIRWPCSKMANSIKILSLDLYLKMNAQEQRTNVYKFLFLNNTHNWVVTLWYKMLTVFCVSALCFWLILTTSFSHVLPSYNMRGCIEYANEKQNKNMQQKRNGKYLSGEANNNSLCCCFVRCIKITVSQPLTFYTALLRISCICI